MGKTCLNCENKMEASFRFCPTCGQETHDRIVTFKSFISDFLGDYFTFDSKIFRSIIPLFSKPGFLTNEYLAGKRVKYILPLRLYIFISIVFFLLLSLESATEQLSHQDYSETSGDEIPAEFFDSFFNNLLPKFFFVLLPLFALILHGLYYRSKQFYLSHFIFSIHFHAFAFLLFSIYLFISTFDLPEYLFQALLYVSLGYTLIYLFLALKRVYGKSYQKTIAKFLILIFTYIPLLVLFTLIAVYFYYQWQNG